MSRRKGRGGDEDARLRFRHDAQVSIGGQEEKACNMTGDRRPGGLERLQASFTEITLDRADGAMRESALAKFRGTRLEEQI